MRITEAQVDPKRHQRQVRAQIRRAELSVALRRKKRHYLRMATGITSRQPVATTRQPVRYPVVKAKDVSVK